MTNKEFAEKHVRETFTRELGSGLRLDVVVVGYYKGNSISVLVALPASLPEGLPKNYGCSQSVLDDRDVILYRSTADLFVYVPFKDLTEICNSPK